MKMEIEFDLIITGWNYGKQDTKNEHRMGAINCESSCGKLKVNVGIGFKDHERDWDWDMMTDEICEVICESIITSKSKSTHSLFLPRFSRIRENLTEAQSLEDMLSR